MFKHFPKVFLYITVFLCTFSLSTHSNAQTITYDDDNAAYVVGINYHSFFNANEHSNLNNINVTGENFKKQLQAFKAAGYNTISEAQLIAFLNGEGSIPKKSIFLTIDDGYASVYNVAFPILKELNMQAVFFPITNDIARKERLGAPMITWPQVKEIADAKVMQIGSHSHNLHWRGNNNSAGYEAMVSNEDANGNTINDFIRSKIITSDTQKAHRLIFNETGIRTKSYSFPYGVYDKVALESIKRLGYTNFYTTINSYNLAGDGSEEIKRLAVNMHSEADALVERLQEQEQLADAFLTANRDLLISSDITKDAIKIKVISDKDAKDNTLQTKDIRFEIFKVIDGKKVFLKPAAEAVRTLSSPFDAITIEEPFANFSEKGIYSIKVIMTKNNNDKQVAWKTFEVK